MKRLLLILLLVLFGCSKEDNSALIDGYQLQISQLNTLISQLNVQTNQLENQISQMTIDNNNSLIQISALEESLYQIQNTNNELEETISNLEYSLTLTESTNNELEIEIQSLQGQLLSFQSLNASLTDQINQLETELDYLTDNKVQIVGEGGITIIKSQNWTNNFIWVINGKVVVENGETLSIDPGTIIKAESSSGPDSSALIIERGAKLIAVGTPDLPIVFTSIIDELNYSNQNRVSPNLNNEINGYWGGIVLLGNAIIGEDEGIDQINSVASDLYFNSYGGNYDFDNSGILNYISIRHAGISNGSGLTQFAALTLAGVGRNTNIDNIEIFSSHGDGIAIYGGSVNLSNILIYYPEDDAVDIDEGYAGVFDFTLAILAPNSDNNIEADGTEDSQGDNNRASMFNRFHTILSENPTNYKQLGHWKNNISGWFSMLTYKNVSGQKIEGIESSTYKGVCPPGPVSNCLQSNELRFSSMQFADFGDMSNIFSYTSVNDYSDWVFNNTNIQPDWIEFRFWTNYSKIFE
jgi:archaellum component FlaC